MTMLPVVLYQKHKIYIMLTFNSYKNRIRGNQSLFLFPLIYSYSNKWHKTTRIGRSEQGDIQFWDEQTDRQVHIREAFKKKDQKS